MTSLVDVFFLLLLFFMLTSVFMTPHVLNVSVTSGGANISDSAESPMMLLVAEGGRIFSGSKEMGQGDLATLLTAEIGLRPSRRIVIMSTKGVSVQELVTVMDAVRSAGGSNISLSNWQ